MSDIQKQQYIGLTSVLSFGSLPLFIFVYVMFYFNIHVTFVLNILNESKIGIKFYSILFRKSHILNIFCRTEFNKINKNDNFLMITVQKNCLIVYMHKFYVHTLCIRKINVVNIQESPPQELLPCQYIFFFFLS